MSESVQLDLSGYRPLYDVKERILIDQSLLLSAKKNKKYFPLYKKHGHESLTVLGQNDETRLILDTGLYEFIVNRESIYGIFDLKTLTITFDAIKLMEVIKAAKPIKA